MGPSLGVTSMIERWLWALKIKEQGSKISKRCLLAVEATRALDLDSEILYHSPKPDQSTKTSET